jgi:hypothetical protein
MKWFYRWLSHKIKDSNNDDSEDFISDPQPRPRRHKINDRIGSKENTFNIPYDVFIKIYDDCHKDKYNFLLCDLISHTFHKNLREIDYIIEK